MSFSLNSSQIKKYNEWTKIQDKKVAELQKKKFGACGGGYTFEFTPGGLGTHVRVRNGITKEFIDLSEYDDW